MLNPESTVAALVLDHPECARVLQKHRIDFCCRGDRPVAEACAERGLDTAALLAELESVVATDRVEVELRSLPTPELVDYIVGRHHGYLREALPFVATLAKKVARVHGARNAHLIELEAVVDALGESLASHLDDEEARLFPALLDAPRAGVDPHLQAELESMVSEHREVGELLARMRSAADDYRVPDWGCRSYQALFSELERMEADVLRHVHAENYVLKPRFHEA